MFNLPISIDVIYAIGTAIVLGALLKKRWIAYIFAPAALWFFTNLRESIIPMFFSSNAAIANEGSVGFFFSLVFFPEYFLFGVLGVEVGRAITGLVRLIMAKFKSHNSRNSNGLS
jgi:hypothetical protein